MILNSNEYNPLAEIIKLIPGTQRVLTIPLMNDIRKEFFKAGLLAESDEEFEQCLEILRELDIVEIERADNGRILIKQGKNGKITQ